MATRRTNRGASIDFDALIAQASKNSPAVGNMRVNAQGDLLGPGGEIVQKNADRVRKQYQEQPRSATQQVSLKGKNTLTPDSQPDSKQVKTAATAAENLRTAPQPKPAPVAEPVPEPEEFDAPADAEPVGYREVELPNGDIEMVPVYKDTDI